MLGYWNSQGLRGSSLETIINFTNDYYRQKQLALIQKIPTPITPIKVDNKKRTITLAYFDHQSTVDYIGVVQGIAVCFDAKETALKSLPIQNIHEHQMKFMEDFQNQKGISFLLVHFLAYDEFYFLPFFTLKEFWDKAQSGGRKSIPYNAFEKQYLIKSSQGVMLNYLEAINTYLINQENK